MQVKRWCDLSSPTSPLPVLPIVPQWIVVAGTKRKVTYRRGVGNHVPLRNTLGRADPNLSSGPSYIFISDTARRRFARRISRSGRCRSFAEIVDEAGFPGAADHPLILS